MVLLFHFRNELVFHVDLFFCHLLEVAFFFLNVVLDL